MLITATAREDVASFIEALIFVYTILIIAYIFTSMFFNVGGRIPYSRWSRAILDFLRETCEPYIAIFRRFIPPLGPLDLSPMVAIFVLVIIGNIVVSIVRG